MFDFERLDVYQKAVNFAEDIYKVTKDFPKEEQFGIVSQLRRAALSISLNIAEGTGRYSKNERRQFYRISRGSVHECIPLLEISLRQGCLNKETHMALYSKATTLAKMLSGLIKSVGSQ